MAVAIGLDIGGTALKYGLVRRSGEVVYWGIADSYGSGPAERIWDSVFGVIDRCFNRAQSKRLQVSHIGVGTPGVVDSKKGMVLGHCPNLPHWVGQPVKRILRKRYAGLDVHVDNDGNAMALAEQRVGAAKGFGDVLCVTVGTGIGSGVILDGRVLRGHRFAAAEFGHMVVGLKGPLCGCGNHGCVEAYSSAAGILRIAKRVMGRKARGLSVEDITRMAKRGNKTAGRILDSSLEPLGVAIGSVVNLLDPEVVVVGGGILSGGQEVLRRIKRAAYRTMVVGDRGTPPIRKARLGRKAGLVGAAFLGWEK